jgi:D-arabinose 1-dehydrogenase-like Zn-dependent alcohol dehydrogenase
MRVRLTHLLFCDGTPADGLGRESGEGRRVFVPGWLPCGECAHCRRGLVAVCPRGRLLIDPRDPRALEQEIDPRFVSGVDEAAGLAPLDDAHAACAGAVAAVIEATARAGLGPEQVSVWLGRDPRARIGARYSARRGCPSLAASDGTTSPADGDVTLLPPGQGGWADAVRAVAPIGPELRPRRIFVTGHQPETVADALALVEPGATLLFLGAPAVAVPMEQLALCRILVGGGRYHPDLIPEALAAMRTDPDLAEGLIASGEDPPPGRLGLAALA